MLLWAARTGTVRLEYSTMSKMTMSHLGVDGNNPQPTLSSWYSVAARAPGELVTFWTI